MGLEFHPFQNQSPGNTINEIAIAVDIILDQLLELDITEAKKGFQIDFAVGSDLEAIASWLGVQRQDNEDDSELRDRVKALIRSRIPVTIDAIQDMFELITGLRPVIQEDFSTRVYSSGETPPTNEELAAFEVHFNADITKVAETRIINPDGETVTVGHTTNIDSGGAIAAYDVANDPTHQNDISVFLDHTTGIMNLTGGPYLPDTRVDIEYEIIANTDFDTLKELEDNKVLFKELISLSKAAGIKTSDIFITKFFRAWFQDGGTEELTISDIFSISRIHLLEVMNLSRTGWDVITWDYHSWDRPLQIALDLFTMSTNP